MGKVRKKKKSFKRSKGVSTTQTLSSHPRIKDNGTVNLSTEKDDVAQLPDEMMDCSSVVNLTTTASHASSDGQVDGAINKWSKKRKRGLKKEKWRQKIELIKKTEEEKKAEEERRKTVVVGDMQPLVKSLPMLTPSLSNEMKYSKKQGTLTLLGEVEKYHAVLKHPAFQKNPVAVITEHVQNAVASGVL